MQVRIVTAIKAAFYFNLSTIGFKTVRRHVLRRGLKAIPLQIVVKKIFTIILRHRGAFHFYRGGVYKIELPFILRILSTCFSD